MNAAKRKRLEAAGFRVGSAEDFLGLDAEEVAIVEMKIALADKIKTLRQSKNMTQTELAHRLKSSQSRIAKIEAGDASVSIDLLIRAVLAVGASKKEVAKAIANSF